ncbi:hypothetical protein B0H13DRAFT_2341352 [Mycena leptocephala]|nr:hypothetical protein B0H13DRAFT_2341352 [Mycena leptocephala]
MGGGPTASSSISGPLGTLSTTATSIEARLAVLRHTMKAPLPGTAGVHPVKVDDLVIYYDVDPVSSRRIDLGTPTQEDLWALANACHDTEPGVKAIDATKFATRFDVVLLDCSTSRCIYKPQKSTRHDSIIGSLVVIFPITHAGGRYIVNTRTRLVLDPCASSLALLPRNLILALYGPEVLHAMEPLTLATAPLSCPRYPLRPTACLKDDTCAACRPRLPSRRWLPRCRPRAQVPHAPAQEDDFDPTLHFNALNERVTSKTAANRWGAVLQSLKGGDARMRELLYAPRYYTGPPEDQDVLLDDIPDLFGIHEGLDCFSEEEDMSSAAEIAKQGVILQRDRYRMDELKWMRVTRFELISPHMRHGLPVEQCADEPGEGSVAVHWLSDMGEQNLVRTAYIGSDSMIEHQYGTAALFIQIPAVGDRIRSS